MYQYRHIIIQMRVGESNRQLARAGVVSRNKARQVRRVADAQGWLCKANAVPDEQTLAAHFIPGNSALIQTLSQAAAHEEMLKRWVSEGVQASTIYQALVSQHAYKGSYSSVQRFVKQHKATLTFKPTVPLTFAPGEAAQVDFGQGPMLVNKVGCDPIKTWFFIMTLCFSRHQYAELVTDQSVETWLGCHRRAFEWFGGVPGKVIIDNAKCAIIKACYYEPTVQRSYAQYAEHWGFIISPCPVRDPQKKGRVESGVKYAKKNFMPLRTFRDLADANRQLQTWVLTTAGERVHGSTFKLPITEFDTIEKPALLPLPAVLPVIARWEKVTVYNNCHVRFDKGFYSVPYQHVKQTLWLCASESVVKLYFDHQLIAVHARTDEAGNYVTLIEHLPPNAHYYFIRSPEWCREQSEKIGAACHQVITQLLDDNVLDYLRAAQGIVQLSSRYGEPRLEKACARALYFHSVHYKSIKEILQKGLDNEVLHQDSDFDELAAVYCGHSKYLSHRSTH